MAALFSGLPTWADIPADQLERAKLLREFQDPSPVASSEAANESSLPAAALESQRLHATERFAAIWNTEPESAADAAIEKIQTWRRRL